MSNRVRLAVITGLQKFSGFLRISWLLLPSILLLLLGWLAFNTLSQSKDVLLSVMDLDNVNWIILLALLFWAMTVWYSGRVLFYNRKESMNGYPISYTHIPRLLGFLCFSVVLLGFLQLDGRFKSSVYKTLSGILLIAYIPLYFLLAYFMKKIADRISEKRLRAIFIAIPLMIGAMLVISKFIQNLSFLAGSIAFLQIVFLFVVTARRGLMRPTVFPREAGPYAKWIDEEGLDRNWWNRLLYYANIPGNENWMFITFNIVSALSLFLYLLTIVHLPTSMVIGTFSFVLLAFGILSGFFALISLFSILYKINLHIVLLLLILIIGYFTEPHYVQLSRSDDRNERIYNRRPSIDSYFQNWTKERRNDIVRDSVYPVFFVLADGGASRSGYWTASVLGKLEDESKGKFSRHLFCLSGASGGSVGNATFFALLQKRREGHTFSFETEAKNYLSTDFLTFTLARMLGPDFFFPMIPFADYLVEDRAAALEQAMEEGAKEGSVLSFAFRDDFSNFISAQSELPLLFLNTTRMQDGRPGVVSNVLLDSLGSRIDVLKMIPEGRKLRVSSAVILGARFPYISPAGRIGNSYYVDGGYFDNSGAGIVQEMLTRLQQIIRDSLQNDSAHYLGRLRFYVIHATNSPSVPSDLRAVHPLRNNALAPLITLVGSFSTQTDVNNSRLQAYLKLIYNNDPSHYKKASLYYNIDADTLDFPMNWAISDYYRTRMDEQLNRSLQIDSLVWWMKELKSF